jgi:hypothetical protein
MYLYKRGGTFDDVLDQHLPHGVKDKVDQWLNASTEPSTELELPWLGRILNDYIFHLGKNEIMRRGSSDRFY